MKAICLFIHASHVTPLLYGINSTSSFAVAVARPHGCAKFTFFFDEYANAAKKVLFSVVNSCLFASVTATPYSVERSMWLRVSVQPLEGYHYKCQPKRPGRKQRHGTRSNIRCVIVSLGACSLQYPPSLLSHPFPPPVRHPLFFPPRSPPPPPPAQGRGLVCGARARVFGRNNPPPKAPPETQPAPRRRQP